MFGPGKKLVQLRMNDDGSVEERSILAYGITHDSLRVDLDEDISIGDVLEDRHRGHVKRMQVLDVIPQRSGGVMAALNDHYEVRYEIRSRATLDRPKYFDVSSLHPDISAIAAPRLSAGHGNDAVLRAFERIESRVQELSGLSDVGRRLMTAAFNSSQGSPDLDVAGDDLTTEERRDSEREGYKFLFMGATLGIRNTHAHGSRDEISVTDVYELLALASQLMRRLDVAERRLRVVS